SLNLLPGFESPGITAGSKNHTGTGTGLPPQLEGIEPTGGYVLQHLGQIKIHASDNRLRFGIAQPAIELQNLRPGAGEHQPNIEESLVRDSVGCQAFQGRLNNG